MQIIAIFAVSSYNLSYKQRIYWNIQQHAKVHRHMHNILDTSVIWNVPCEAGDYMYSHTVLQLSSLRKTMAILVELRDTLYHDTNFS